MLYSGWMVFDIIWILRNVLPDGNKISESFESTKSTILHPS